MVAMVIYDVITKCKKLKKSVKTYITLKLNKKFKKIKLFENFQIGCSLTL